MKAISFRVLFPVLLMLFFSSLTSILRADTTVEGVPEELRTLQIRDEFVGSPFKEVGYIGELKGMGKVVVVHRANKDAYYGGEGDVLYENDAIYTLADCRCRLRFKDKNVAIMAPDTHIDIDKVYFSALKGQKKSIFGMTKGKAIFYVLRLLRYAQTDFEVKTPNAAIGVRGTKFGAEIERVGKDHAVGMYRMLASASHEPVAMEQGKVDMITRAYVFEGSINVTSLIDGSVKSLRENETMAADKMGLGEVKFDPAGTSAFMGYVSSGMEKDFRPESEGFGSSMEHKEMDLMERNMDIRQGEIKPPAKSCDPRYP